MVKLGIYGGLLSPITVSVGLEDTGTLVTYGKVTTIPGIDTGAKTSSRIGPETPMIFIVLIVFTLEATNSRSRGSLQPQDVSSGLTMGVKILSLLK